MSAKKNRLISRMTYRVLLVINIVIAILLLCSYLARFVSPNQYTFFIYIGMIFPIILFFNILFVLFWLYKAKLYFFISTIIIGLSYPNIQISFPLNIKKEVAATDASLKILSYNINFFDFYKKSSGTTYGSHILDFIVNENADIVCLQEFGYSEKRQFLQLKDIDKALSKKYPHKHVQLIHTKNESYTGIVTFSKYPILTKKEIEYGSVYNKSIYSDIDFNGERIRIINCHLESNKLTHEERQSYLDIINQELNNEDENVLSTKIENAVTTRSKQARKIAEEINNSPYKTIVCGDFNDIPISYTYNTISKNLTDAFAVTKSGFGATYNENLYLLRIDYFLCDKRIEPFNFNIGGVKYSDHYPISCSFNINN